MTYYKVVCQNLLGGAEKNLIVSITIRGIC